MQKRNLWPTLLVLGVILVGLVAFYGRVLIHPNSTMMGSSADAIKNYYTPWYHAKWDSTYTWFEGMNYPYGDHVVFADAQPLLSNAIKICGLADYTVGIMNYAMLLSLLLAGWLLFRIQLRWGVDAWWAAIAAACIALLSPQILKFNAHYGLAYAFAVPLVWHLALRAFEKPSIPSSLTLTLTLFMMGWLHPYYVMISAVFLTALWLMHSLLTWKETKFLHKVSHFALQVLLPVMLFTVVLKLTDPVTDRPSNPYGMNEYVATWKSLFLPLALKGIDSLVPEAWRGNGKIWEGIGYVGIVSVLTFLAYWARTTVRLGKSVLQRKWKQFLWLEDGIFLPETKNTILVSMLAGVLVGLFACGIPFAIKSEMMTIFFPPIKQFRSLGRFSWVFFYTWASFSFYLIWLGMRYLKGRKLNMASWFLGGIVTVFTLGEGAALNAGVSERIDLANPTLENPGNSEIVLGDRLNPEIKIAASKAWNAMIVLPFFHEGSENFHTPLPKNSRMAFQASIYTGQPMFNVMMSRTSLSQTWSMLELITEPEPDRTLEITRHLPPLFRIFAIRTGDSDTLDGARVQPSTLWYKIPSMGFYDLVPSSLEESISDPSYLVPSATFPFSYDIQTSRPEPGLIWQDFEDEVGNGYRDGTIEGFAGGIGHRIVLKDNNWFHDGPVQFQAGDTVIVSLWIKMKEDGVPLTELGWEEWHDGEKVNWHYLSLNNSIKRIVGDWALCEREEVVSDPHNQIKINLTRWKRWPEAAIIDKLMVRRKGTNVYGFEQGNPVWLNNRRTNFEPPILLK